MCEQVKGFLLEFKRVVTQGSGVDLVRRHDTLETLRYLGLTKRDLEEILLGLTVTAYCAGPKPDRDRPGEVWEFGRDIDGLEIYIKLKVADIQGRKIAKCISFHIAAHSMRYPYRT